MHYRPDLCPVCEASWVGDEIPPENRHHYGGLTHFRRWIAIYDWYRDVTVAYACPDCNAIFDRWSFRRIHPPPHANRLN